MLPPPPASVRLPRIGGPGAAADDNVGYQLIPFPWEPWRLTYPNRAFTQPMAADYARWLNEADAGRLGVIMGVLGDAGAPTGGLPGRPETLKKLGRWIQRWFGLVTAQLMDGFIRDDPE